MKKVKNEEMLFLIAVILSFGSSTIFQNILYNFFIPVILLLCYIIIKLYNFGLNLNYIKISFLLILWLFINTLILIISKGISLDGAGNLIGTIIVLLILSVNINNTIDSFWAVLSIKFITVITILTSFFNLIGILSINPHSSSVGYSWYFTNTNSYGAYLMFLFLFYLYFVNNNKRKIIVLLFLSVLIVLSLSRIVLFIMILNSIIYLLFRLNKKQKVFSLVLLVAVIPIIFLQGNIKSYIEVINVKNNTFSSGRVDIWIYTLRNYIFNSPFTFILGNGIGFGALNEFEGKGTHNSYLTAMGKYGFIYMISFLILLFKIIRDKLTNDKLMIGISLLLYATVESSYFTGLNGGWISSVFLLVFASQKIEVNSSNMKGKQNG